MTIPASACVYCDAMGSADCNPSHATDADQAPLFARFTLQGGQQPQPGGDGTPLTVTYSYNNFLDGGLKDPNGISVPADFLRLVTEEAFGLWAAVAPIHFLEVPDVGTTVFTINNSLYNAFSSDDFGTIRLNHRFINGTDAQNGRPTTKALAYSPSTPRNLGSDIHFDNGDPWAINGTASEPDVLGIMVHEIGHTLGIGHSQFDGAVMFPAALRRMGPGTGLLTQDDISAVQAIYGAGFGSVTPIPEPTSWLIAILGCLSLGRRTG